MVFGSKPKVDVTEYSLSVHFGIAAGPLDAITEIRIGEKVAWSGRATALSSLAINKPNLFGGQKKEGGPIGQAIYLPGGAAQVLPGSLAAKLGLSSSTAPAYRGLGSLWFTGGGVGVPTVIEDPEFGDVSSLPPALRFALIRQAQASGQAISNSKGFIWTMNSPNIPTVEVKAERAPKGLNPAQAMIGPDANPAHMIYECLTDQDWGMGENPSLMDVASFNAAAETLIAEEFGLSMVWTAQAEIEKFVNEIINHIQATIFIHPRTGLWTLKLLRDDYDVNAIPSFDDSNSLVASYQRRGHGETANEVVVSWTNPSSEESEAVSVQDLSGIAAQGGRIVSDSRDYFGIRKRDLAGRVAVRDLRSVSAPLATVEVIVDRSGWDLVPGAVIKLSSIEHNFTNVVFRVTKADYGRVNSGGVKLSLVEDVFSFSYENYYQPSPSQWQDPSAEPEDMPYVQPFTIPAFFVPRVVSELPVAPEVILGLFAAAANDDTPEFAFAEEATDPGGELFFEIQSERATVARGALSAPLVSEGQTTFETPSTTSGDAFIPGNFVLIGAGSDEQLEIAYIRQVADEVGLLWTLDRGVLDTVPRNWPAGTQLWVFSLSTPFDDDIPREPGALTRYKLLPSTSLGSLDVEDATIREYTMIDRPYRPLRPANVKVNGQGFGQVDARETPIVTATWANRNRLTELDALLQWTAPGVAPEAGQTTVIEVRDIDGNLVNTITGLSGESHTFDLDYDLMGLPIVSLRFLSEVGSVRSLQGHDIQVRLRTTGYGYGYGLVYGGEP